MKKEQGAVLISALFVTFGLFITAYAWLTLEFMDGAVPGPGFMPVVCAGALTVVGVMNFLSELRRAAAAREPGAAGEQTLERKSLKLPAGIVLTTFLAIILFQLAGAIPTMFLYVFVLLKVFGNQSWKRTVIISVLFTLVIWAIFDLFLNIPLPSLW